MLYLVGHRQLLRVQIDRKGVYIYRTKGECTAELHYYPLRQEKAKRNPEKLCDAQEVLSFSLSFI